MQPQNLRALREKLKLTQQELAELLEVSPNTVARWERGEVPILKVTALAVEHLRCKGKKKPAA